MKVTPLHAQRRWSDYELARLRSGNRIRMSRKDPTKWGASPTAPSFFGAIFEDSIELHVDRGAQPEQIDLGGVAASVERLWTIENARDFASVATARALVRLIGWRAALYRNNWKKRVYRNPLRIRRSMQSNQPGFDALCRLIAAQGPRHTLTNGELFRMSVDAIGPTLEPAEARRFYEWANR